MQDEDIFLKNGFGGSLVTCRLQDDDIFMVKLI